MKYQCYSMALGPYTRYAPELATHGRYDVMSPAKTPVALVDLWFNLLTHFNDPPSSLLSSAQG